MTGRCWACAHWNLKVSTSCWKDDRGKCFVNAERDGHSTMTGGEDSCPQFQLDADDPMSAGLHAAGYPDEIPEV